MADLVLVTGGTGFLGQQVCRVLRAHGHDAIPVHRVSGDLRHLETVHSLLKTAPWDAVVHLAYPGSRFGIETSVKTPHTLASDLIQMDLNVIDGCVALGIPKLLCVGSACAYPEHTTLPTDESQLWAGYPEPVNAAYGLAKRTQLMLLQAARQEHGLNGIHLILANMYGPGDRTQHVIPALITRLRQAVRDRTPLTVWGQPDVTRSFLYVEDAAEGIVRALAAYDSPEPLNVVRTEETSMEQLVTTLMDLLGIWVDVRYDATKPTGHRRRCFSDTRLREALGWVPPTPLREGLRATLDWHLREVPLD